MDNKYVYKLIKKASFNSYIIFKKSKIRKNKMINGLYIQNLFAFIIHHFQNLQYHN